MPEVFMEKFIQKQHINITIILLCTPSFFFFAVFDIGWNRYFCYSIGVGDVQFDKPSRCVGESKD